MQIVKKAVNSNGIDRMTLAPHRKVKDWYEISHYRNNECWASVSDSNYEMLNEVFMNEVKEPSWKELERN